MKERILIIAIQIAIHQMDFVLVEDANVLNHVRISLLDALQDNATLLEYVILLSFLVILLF